jgi:23S rRNA pseudouridine955/2504/2580 synthase
LGPNGFEFNRLLEIALASTPSKSGYAALKKLSVEAIAKANSAKTAARKAAGRTPVAGQRGGAARQSVEAFDARPAGAHRIGSLRETERVQNTRDRKDAADANRAASPRGDGHPEVRQLKVDFEHVGQRIDNYLVRELKGAPKSLVYRILRSGEVRVNSKRIKPDYRVQHNDMLRIPPIRLAEQTAVAPPAQSIEWLAGEILHEDKALIVLNKPSGLASHGGSGLSYGAIEAMRALKPRESLELVHRLDRDTSGLLLISKKRSLLTVLQTAMRDGEVTKRYQALVLGSPKNDRFEINLPLLKNELAGGERIVKVSEDGKAARTFFTVLERFDGATLVQAELGTGRTHQIRVHAQAAGHPLAADPKYGDETFNQRVRTLGLKRLFLHAVSVAWKQDSELRSFQSALPDELLKLLAALRLKSVV